MNKLNARFWGVWGGSFVVVAVITIAILIAVWFLPAQHNQRVESSALVLAALMIGWSAWQSRSLAYLSKEQIEEMVRPSLSLIPRDYLLSGDFTTLLLQNTGGLAKEVKIDIGITNSREKQLLFVPAIDKDHVVFLPIDAIAVKKNNGMVRVNVELLDCHGRKSAHELSVDFGKLKEEGRGLAFESSLVLEALDKMTT